MLQIKNLFLCCGLAGALCACGGKPAADKAPNENNVAVMTVTTVTPQRESIPLIINANGLIQAWQETIISAEVGGLDLIDVEVNVGDKVKKGQLLAQLNAAQINADLMGQIADVAEAKANLEKANIEANQARSLEKLGAISSQELLQYLTTQKTTQAKLNAANANLSLQQLKLSYTKVISPDDGVISSRTATAGSIVQSGSELFRLIRHNKLEWQAEVGLDELNQIESGQVVTIQVNSNAVINGRVRQISPVLNLNSKSGIVYIDIPAESSLKIGMSVTGSIYAGSSVGLVIPFKAVISSDGYNYVMQYSKIGRVHKIKVELGQINAKMVEVKAGLKPTDRIVVDGASFLNESDLVTLAKVK